MQTKILIPLLFLVFLSFVNPASAKDKKKQTEPVQLKLENNAANVLSKFKNCKEANAAGVSNVPVTPDYIPPGWNHSSDRNKDGIACEKKR
jgi:Excalibur calcium-binding domain